MICVVAYSRAVDATRRYGFGAASVRVSGSTTLRTHVDIRCAFAGGVAFKLIAAHALENREVLSVADLVGREMKCADLEAVGLNPVIPKTPFNCEKIISSRPNICLTRL